MGQCLVGTYLPEVDAAYCCSRVAPYPTHDHSITVAAKLTSFTTARVEPSIASMKIFRATIVGSQSLVQQGLIALGKRSDLHLACHSIMIIKTDLSLR